MTEVCISPLWFMLMGHPLNFRMSQRSPKQR
jgi:hypothetical protein